MNKFKIEVFTSDSNTCYNSKIYRGSLNNIESYVNDIGFRKYWLPKEWSKLLIFDMSSNEEYEDIECIDILEPIMSFEPNK